MTLHKYPRKQVSSISQSSANRPFQKTVPDASSSSYVSPFLSFPGWQHSHSSVASPSLHALAIGAPHAKQICERLLYLRVPGEGYDTPSGWAGGATSRWWAGSPVFVRCQGQRGSFGAESIPGGVRRKALGRAFGQCGVTYSTQGPFQLTYFITSTQPRKYSQELADNGYAPKATCYPFARFTTPKCLTIISFQKQAQLSKQQSLPLQKYGNIAKCAPLLLLLPCHDNISTVQENTLNSNIVPAASQGGKTAALSRKPVSWVPCLLPFLLRPFRAWDGSCLAKQDELGVLCRRAASRPPSRVWVPPAAPSTASFCSRHLCTGWIETRLYVLALVNKMLLFTSAIRLEE